MTRIGRVGEKWGAWTLTGRAGIAWDGKRAWWATIPVPPEHDGATGYFREGVVVIQRRRARGVLGLAAGTKFARTAWEIDSAHLIPENWLGTFQSWHSMVERCCRPSHKSYADYGGRGIHIYMPWGPNSKGRIDRINAFMRFCQDMGLRPAGTSLDRINPHGHYEPDNCRWADKLTQAHNKRRRWPKYGMRVRLDEAVSLPLVVSDDVPPAGLFVLRVDRILGRAGK